jgi:hypothetical protein
VRERPREDERDRERQRETERDRERQRQRGTTADTGRGIEAPPRGGTTPEAAENRETRARQQQIGTDTSQPAGIITTAELVVVHANAHISAGFAHRDR